MQKLMEQEEDEKFMRQNIPPPKNLEISKKSMNLEISSPVKQPIARDFEIASPIRQPMRLQVSTPISVRPAVDLEISSLKKDLDKSSLGNAETKLLDALLAQQQQIMQIQQAAISDLKERLEKKEEISSI